MAIFTGQDTKFTPGSLSSGSATATSTPGCDVTTSPVERFLLLVTVMLYPLEAQIRIVPNVSSMFLMFAVLAGYVAINRLRYLDRVWMHPVFVAAYLFIGISVTLEFTSPLPGYEKIVSFALMIVGALFVASLCRDRAALKTLLYGYIGGALWLGALLVITSYGTLSGVVATDAGPRQDKEHPGKTGFVVRCGYHEMLVKRLMELITDRDLYQSMGKAG